MSKWTLPVALLTSCALLGAAAHVGQHCPRTVAGEMARGCDREVCPEVGDQCQVVWEVCQVVEGSVAGLGKSGAGEGWERGSSSADAPCMNLTLCGVSGRRDRNVCV